jgi:surfeit locus 1 family protein
VPIKIGSQSFAGRVFTAGVTLALLLALLSLGRWQLRRAHEQQAEIDRFTAGTESTLRIGAATARLPRFQHVETTGHYDAEHQVLIDNVVDADGRAGYLVITPFEVEGNGWVLVNRGWVPLGASRAQRPAVGVSEQPRSLRGRVGRLPSPGLQMGHPAPLAPPFPAVATFPLLPDLHGFLHKSSWSDAADVVLLDADQPDGYVRAWGVTGLSPMRHLAYAVQWFGLALTLAVIYVVTLRRRPRGAASA